MRRLDIIARICYWTGISWLFYRLNKGAKRILAFHNVLPSDMYEKGIANIVTINEDQFIDILHLVMKRHRVSNDLNDHNTVTITFDDGYHNQYAYAYKIMSRYRMEGIIFEAKNIDYDKGLIVDKLLHWISYVPAEVIAGKNRWEYWQSNIWPRFCKSKDKGYALFEELNLKYPFKAIMDRLDKKYLHERLAGISDEEKNEMRNNGWQIGWHTRSHFPLAFLSDEEIRSELTCPAEYKGVVLAYPYGREETVGMAAINIARECGFPCAVSMVNDSEWNESKYFLPRISVSADKYLFHLQMSGLEFFIRHRRLLPKVK